jgi:hypothetical protein
VHVPLVVIILILVESETYTVLSVSTNTAHGEEKVAWVPCPFATPTIPNWPANVVVVSTFGTQNECPTLQSSIVYGLTGRCQ